MMGKWGLFKSKKDRLDEMKDIARQEAEHVLGAMLPDSIEGIVAAAAKRYERDYHTQMAQVVNDAMEEIRRQAGAYVENCTPEIRDAVKGYLTRETREGGIIARAIQESYSKALEEMLPAYYDGQLPEDFSGYEKIKDASFIVDDHEQTYTDWAKKSAVADCKDDALKSVKKKALAAGAALGAEVVLFRNPDTKILTDEESEYDDDDFDFKLTAWASVQAEFYKRK